MSNNDYILRSDALKAIRYENWREENRVPSIEGLHLTKYQLLAKAINDIHAADVVPVVRCKDCKYKPTAPDGITYGLQVEFPDKWANRCPCLCEDGWYSWVPDDDFFCAYGVKEDGDGTV